MTPQFAPIIKYTEALTSLAKDFVEIQTSSLARLNVAHKDAVTALCEKGVSQLQSVAAPKDYQEWLEMQTKYLSESGALAQKIGVDYLKAFEDGQTAFTAWLQKGTESVSQSANELFKLN